MIRTSLSALALGAALLAGTGAAFAQSDLGPGPGVPPGRYEVTFAGQHRIQGVVRNFGGFNMTVRIHGDIVPVNLHQGTIIHPTGLTLQRGMLVRCEGYFNGNGLFIAERIELVR